jgi:hypothetical protein
MKNVPTIKSVPSFTIGAASVVAAKAKLGKSELTFESACESAFAKFIDACVIRGVQKTEESCKAIRAEIVSAFKDSVKTKDEPNRPFTKATIDNYSQGAQRAFFHDAKWTARAFQAVDKGGIPALPWSTKAKIGAPTKAGSISKTTVLSLMETLVKALEQAKLLNMDAIHGAILDVCVEIDPDFKV